MARKITRMESHVLEQVAMGKTNKEIALSLALEDSTVAGYLRSIYQKWGVANRTAAAIKYYQQSVPLSQSKIGNSKFDDDES